MSLTDRQQLAATGNFGPPPASFVHEPAANKPPAPDTAFEFTADSVTDLLTTVDHGLAVGERIRVANSGGALPAGLTAGTDYYVISAGLTDDDFAVSTVLAGSAVDITGAGSGTNTWQRYLDASEQIEFDAYVDFITGVTITPPTDPVLPNAILAIAAYGAYLESPAYLNWKYDDEGSRDSQYRLRRAEILLANTETVPPAASSTGTGSGAPSSPIAPGDPTKCEPVDFTIASGVLGGAITLDLTSVTGGASIYYRKPPGYGTWILYTGTPVSMSAGEFLEAYATAAGLAQSDTTTFENA